MKSEEKICFQPKSKGVHRTICMRPKVNWLMLYCAEDLPPAISACGVLGQGCLLAVRQGGNSILTESLPACEAVCRWEVRASAQQERPGCASHTAVHSCSALSPTAQVKQLHITKEALPSSPLLFNQKRKAKTAPATLLSAVFGCHSLVLGSGIRNLHNQ